jgi:hypothetical protein
MVASSGREGAALQNLPCEAIPLMIRSTIAPYDGSFSAPSATFKLDLGHLWRKLDKHQEKKKKEKKKFSPCGDSKDFFS